MPMMRGLTAADAQPRTRARGVMPASRASLGRHQHDRRGAVGDARRRAGGDDARLSFDFAEHQRQLAQRSRLSCQVADARRSSPSTDDPWHPSRVTGAISSSNRPAAIAAPARRCVSSA